MAESPVDPAETTHAAVTDQTVSALLGAIARKSPAPGGGAVASAAGALAAALAGMVLAYSVGKKSLAQHAEAHERLTERAEQAGRRLLELADADAEAYAHMNALQRLDAGDERREAELPAAVQRCVDVPLEVQSACLALLVDFEQLAPIANAWLLSDLKIAAILAEAALRASACNVAVNVPALRQNVGGAPAAAAERASDEACDRGARLLRSIESRIDA